MALSQDPDGVHLSYEEVRDAAEGRPSKVASRHLESCPQCRTEVADLHQFAATLGRKPAVRRAPVMTMRRWAIAALILIGVPISWWIWRSLSGLDYVIALKDGGGWVGLDRQGQLHTPAQIPADCAAAVKEALASHRLPVREDYRGAAKEVLLGPPRRETAPALTLIYPLGEAVLTGQPQFEWRATLVPESYRVRLYDRNFKLVMESPELHSETWTPGTPLAPGNTYTWEVTARVGPREVRAPVPPAPEARFEVLPQDESSRLEELRRQFASQHLMLAAEFARAGALRPAREELDALRRANPGSTLVRQIAASL